MWRMMRGATASTHFEPLHKLKAHSSAWGRIQPYTCWCFLTARGQQPSTPSGISQEHPSHGINCVQRAFQRDCDKPHADPNSARDARSDKRMLRYRHLMSKYSSQRLWHICHHCSWCTLATIPDPACCAGYVTKCLLSPDMQKLATVSSDKTIKLWNIDGFTLDRTLTGRFPSVQTWCQDRHATRVLVGIRPYTGHIEAVR